MVLYKHMVAKRGKYKSKKPDELEHMYPCFGDVDGGKMAWWSRVGDINKDVRESCWGQVNQMVAILG
jgi:hypothetical protein